jgi:uncharacterized protein YjiS (DUF1127 family)
MPACSRHLAPISLRPAARPRFVGLGAVAAWARRYAERARQRRAIARLDDRLLRDIGLSRTDVQSEMARPFWRP